MSVDKLRIFEDAFRSGYGSIRMLCNCGKTYYDQESSDFDPGEFEELEKDPNAVALSWGAFGIEFEGRHFVVDCDCWKKRAMEIIGFIDGHRNKLAQYLNGLRDKEIARAKTKIKVIEPLGAREGEEG